ncbi:MAG: EamA family transporter, partial [Anaerotignum sp.]|nr:EamA family transporter [Anaerotignum sp.]
LLMFFLTGGQKNLLQEFSKANWATYVLAATIVFLEFGYLMVYRAGWPISIASLISNLVVCCILLFVGVLFYKESISARQLIGCAVCVIGLIMVSK